jgi:hypothetical protein
MAEENEPRVYGMADQANRDPPSAEGLRGEKSTLTPQDEGNPALRRRVTLDTGAIVEVREESGVGWAEAVGRAGLVENAPHLAPAEDHGAAGPPADPKVMPRQQVGAARRPGTAGLLIALAVLGVAGLSILYERRRLTASA